MKNITVLFMFVCLVFIVLSCKDAETQDAKETNVSPLVGTWEYLGEQEGLVIATETHFIYVIKSQTTVEDTLSEAETSIESKFAAGGTYSFSDSLFTWNRMYSTIPNQAGTSLQTVSTFEGDMTYFKILNSDGSVGFTGSARRIASN